MVVELELDEDFIQGSSDICLVCYSFLVTFCILYLVKVLKLHLLENRGFLKCGDATIAFNWHSTVPSEYIIIALQRGNVGS